jgi:hypothetical protein
MQKSATGPVGRDIEHRRVLKLESPWIIKGEFVELVMINIC